jgi:hypothetical protein
MADPYGQAQSRSRIASNGMEGPEGLINFAMQEGDPYKNREKGVIARLRNKPGPQTLPIEKDLGPEVGYQENWSRANINQAARQKISNNEPMTDAEARSLKQAPVYGPDVLIGPDDPLPSYVRSRPKYSVTSGVDVIRTLRADQPEMDIGGLGQNWVVQNEALEPIGKSGRLAEDIYDAALFHKPSGSRAYEPTVYDIPLSSNQLKATGGDKTYILGEIGRQGGGEMFVNTGRPERRNAILGDYGYATNEYYDQDLGKVQAYADPNQIYQDLSARPVQDRSVATGHYMDTNQGLGQTIEGPDYKTRKADLLWEYSQGKNPPLPRGGYFYETKFGPGVYLPREVDQSTVGTLGSTDLGRRLRAQGDFMGDVATGLGIREENPVQLDYSNLRSQAISEADAAARARGANLDAALINNRAVVNPIVSDIPMQGGKPYGEFYLYGSDTPKPGVMPEGMQGASAKTDTLLDPALYQGSPYNSRPMSQIELRAGKTGVGVPIDRSTPFNRAFIKVPEMGYVPVDPLTPLDYDNPAFFNYGQAKGIDPSGLPPEEIQATASREANRYIALADREYARGMKDRGDRYMELAGLKANQATTIEGAMDVITSQSVPQETANMSTVYNPGTSMQRQIVQKGMPFRDVVERVQSFRDQPQPTLNIPRVPRPSATINDDQLGFDDLMKQGGVYGEPDEVTILSDQNTNLYKQIAERDPQATVNQLRRGVQVELRPDPITGKVTEIVRDPGVPVIDPITQAPMAWQGEPIYTYNPRTVGNAEVSRGVRVIPSRGSVRREELNQLAEAIGEGYVPGKMNDPTSWVPITGEELSDMRRGLSGADMRAAVQHNRVRELVGMPQANPVALRDMQVMSGVPMADRSVDLIRNPPVQGGVFQMGPTNLDSVAMMSRDIPTSGGALQLSPGGMIPSVVTEIPQAQRVVPSVRQVPAVGDLGSGRARILRSLRGMV